jgi:hypothetical protein
LAFGGRDSHPSCRYSRQHTRFQDLQDSSRYPFTGDWNAPLPHGSQKSEVRRQTPDGEKITRTCSALAISTIESFFILVTFCTKSRRTFRRPYPTSDIRLLTSVSAASVHSLSPVIFSARIHLTSELLRFLSRVAASKPTSWLSVCFHILFHLTVIWGP